jgi:hypothetical protein
MEPLESRELLSVFTVTNTNDSGAGSLRQAIVDANAHANGVEADQIAFNIAGSGVHAIQPLSALPAITDAVVIDGYTQPGASKNTLAVGDNAVLEIEIDGSQAGTADGLSVTGGGTTIEGLVINRFAGDGISIEVSSSTVFQDSAWDTLYGEGGRDWFVSSSEDWRLDRVLFGSSTETYTKV